jgi:hypothetical protein
MRTVSRTATNYYTASPIFSSSIAFGATLTPIITASLFMNSPLSASIHFHASLMFMITLISIQVAFLAVNPIFAQSRPFDPSSDFRKTNHLFDLIQLLGSFHFPSTPQIELSSPFAMTLTFTQTAVLPSQDPRSSDSRPSDSGLSAGLIVGIVISILAVVIGAVIGFVLRRRGCRSDVIDSQSNGAQNSSIPKIDFTDEQIEGDDDIIVTISTDDVTDEEDLQMVVSIPTGFAVSLPSPLIL